MYNIAGRQYILKMSSGHFINIYYKPNTGLCCRELTAGNSWTLPAIILKNALPDFSVCLDTADNIHLLCQDEKGSLVYIRYKDGTWLNILISRNRNIKNPYICKANEKLHLFYVVETSDKSILVYQTFSEGCMYSPKVIDSVRKSSKSHTVLCDNNGTIYLFYIIPTVDILYYRILDTGRDELSDFFDTGMNLSKIQLLSISGDQNGDFHLCLQRTSVQKYELLYLNIRTGQEIPCNVTPLSSSPYNFLNSSLLVSNQKIIIYWVRENNLLYRMSYDNGISWSKPEKLGSFDMRLFYCTRYYANDSKDIMQTINADIPAMLSDGYQPAFMNEFSWKHADDFNTVISSAIKIIADMDEINEAVNGTVAAYKKLEEKVQSLTVNYNRFIVHQLQTDRDIIMLKSGVELLKSGDTLKTPDQVQSFLPVAPSLIPQE